MQPSENVFAAARAMFKTLWNRCLASQLESKRTLDAERSTIERQVEQFLDRIADTDVPSIVATYEKRIRDLEERKIVLAERIANCGRALPRCPTSMTHLKLRSTSYEIPEICGIHRARRTSERC